MTTETKSQKIERIIKTAGRCGYDVAFRRAGNAPMRFFKCPEGGRIGRVDWFDGHPAFTANTLAEADAFVTGLLSRGDEIDLLQARLAKAEDEAKWAGEALDKAVKTISEPLGPFQARAIVEVFVWRNDRYLRLTSHGLSGVSEGLRATAGVVNEMLAAAGFDKIPATQRDTNIASSGLTWMTTLTWAEVSELSDKDHIVVIGENSFKFKVTSASA